MKHVVHARTAVNRPVPAPDVPISVPVYIAAPPAHINAHHVPATVDAHIGPYPKPRARDHQRWDTHTKIAGAHTLKALNKRLQNRLGHMLLMSTSHTLGYDQKATI
jgi:hypothetical protein